MAVGEFLFAFVGVEAEEEASRHAKHVEAPYCYHVGLGFAYQRIKKLCKDNLQPVEGEGKGCTLGLGRGNRKKVLIACEQLAQVAIEEEEGGDERLLDR